MCLRVTEVFTVVMMTVVEVLMTDSDTEMHPKRTFYFESADFTKIASTTAFVDKTLLIREFFKAPNLVLITTPSKFGKSTNMDMLKKFIQIPLAEDVQPIHTTEETLLIVHSEEETENTDPFEKHHFNISLGKQFCSRHKGKYPVIHIDFKSIQGITYDVVFEHFKTLMFKIFNKHKYLLNSKRLDDVKKTIIRKYYNTENNSTLIDSEVIRSLQFLTKYLHLHYKKRVIVLWDNYDAPIGEAMHYNSSDTLRIVDFLQKLTKHVLKDNQYVERAFINARNTLLARLLTTNLTIKHYPFLSAHSLAPFYGFTESEVRNLVERFNVTERFNDVKLWYAGYKLQGKSVKVFNVLSIVRFLESERIESYWIVAGCSIPRLLDIVLVPAIRIKLMNLIRDRSVVINNVSLSLDQLIMFQYFLYSPLKYIPESINYVDLFFRYLLDSGYLHVIKDDGETLTLSIPNAEVAHELLQNMYSAVVNREDLAFDPVQARPVTNALELLRARYHNITY